MRIDRNMDHRRMVILTEGLLGTFSSKTAASLIRYKPEETVAVLDSVHAGKKLEDVLEVGHGIPIVSTMEEALAYGPTSLVIGIATPGGVLPGAWRAVIHEAIENGLEVVSGLHTFLNEDEAFARHAEQKGVRLWDVRQPPDDLDVGRHLVHGIPNLRVLTVGADSSIGKKVAAIEISRAALEAGWDAEFVATGADRHHDRRVGHRGGHRGLGLHLGRRGKTGPGAKRQGTAGHRRTGNDPASYLFGGIAGVAPRFGAAGACVVPSTGTGRDAQSARGRSTLRGDDSCARNHRQAPVPLPGRGDFAQLFRHVDG